MTMLFACTVNADPVAPVMTSTRGINAQVTRVGVGEYDLALDQALAPHEYALCLTVTDPTANLSTINAAKTLKANVARILVRVREGGAPADLDFDVVAYKLRSI